MSARPHALEQIAPAHAAPRCGARSKRTGCPCRAPAMPNGRCRMHGGLSTGPRTQAGRAAIGAARLKHGRRSNAAIAAGRLRALAKRQLQELLVAMDLLDEGQAVPVELLRRLLPPDAGPAAPA
jgi:hypothetical protein